MSSRDAEAARTDSVARHSTAPMTDNNALEKDFSQNHQHLGANTDAENALRQIRTAGSISISPELFEKLYLSPQNAVKGDLRKTFGNPTPIALIGFLLSLTPLCMDLMGWRGAGGDGAATIGFYFFAGGVLMILGSIGEWILGNTFPFVVFGTFGAFWLGLGSTLQPFYNAYGAYKNPNVASSTGLESTGFNVGFGYLLLCMAVVCLIFLICSIRTNLVFFMIFFTLVIAFALLGAAFLHVGEGEAGIASKLQKASGAFLFVTCMCGWYIFFAIMLLSVDFPFALPLVDLSGMIQGASQKRKVEHVE